MKSDLHWAANIFLKRQNEIRGTEDPRDLSKLDQSVMDMNSNSLRRLSLLTQAEIDNEAN